MSLRQPQRPHGSRTTPSKPSRWLAMAICASLLATIAPATGLAADTPARSTVPPAEGANAANRHYVVNRSPLRQTAYVHLPPGAVRPTGWLRDQLRVQADGQTSYLWSAFSCASVDANPPYHQEGVVALALVLGDHERLNSLAKGYVNRRLTLPNQPALTFGNASCMRFLMEYQEATDDPRIVPWMVQWYQRAGTAVPNDGGWEYQGCHEHLLALYWLYNRTGDAALLKQAREIVVRENPPPERWRGDAVAFTTLPESRVPGIDDIASGFLRFPEFKTTTHGVVTAWRIKYPALFYQQDPQERYRRAVVEGVTRLERHFGQIAGRFAAHENFPTLATGRHPSHGTELCCSAEYAFAMEQVFEILGDPAAGDRIEALAYNTWPAQMTADMWCHQYDVQANQVVVSVAERGWDNSAWANIYGLVANWTCCLANKHQGWPRLVKNLWLATHDNGLLAAAYGPCEVTAQVGAEGARVTIREDTEYPFDGLIRLTIRSDRPVAFPLHLRIPAWAEDAVLRSAGQSQPAKAGTVVVLNRSWQTGDSVELVFPMRLALEERWNKAVAVRRGPLYFGLRIGQEFRECPWENPGQGPGKLSAKTVRQASGFPVFDWEIHPTTPWNYALQLDRQHPEKSLSLARHPVGAIPFAGQGEPVLVKVPTPDAAGLAKAAFQAELGPVLPHPAEANLKHDGQPWTLGASEANRRVGFDRRVWTQAEPLVLKAKARRIPSWTWQPGKNPVSGQMVPAIAAAPPLSPVSSSEPEVEVELVPLGCTRLRVAEFPVLETTRRAASPWAGYRFAPDALQEMDLASDSAWTLSLDGGPGRPIRVTAGGWNSDQQQPPLASDAAREFVEYRRDIPIPSDAQGQVIKLLFGGCNYGAEVWLDDRRVAEHHGPLTPFEADVTAVARPGQTQTLRVKAWTRFHYGNPPTVPVPFDFNAGVSKQLYPGNTKFPYGLTGHVRLAVYPAVHVADVFVRPAVSKQSLECDVWIANTTAQPRSVTLAAGLSAWGDRSWAYPAIPDQTVALAPNATQKVTVRAAWTLGPDSYWWPNIPFREDYRATLHWLSLVLREDGQVRHERRERFGFVEHAEGPYYYTVNGVRYTSYGDSNSCGQIGEYDCWTETPCFQPPQGEFRGCLETWRRYQRIGFNSMRLSTSVPTRFMLETADEAGYLLVPEGGSWGNGTSVFHAEHFTKQLQETIRACRNHPCVARYSMANESLPSNPESPNCAWRALIDAAAEVDDQRPYVFEVNPGLGTGPIPGFQRGHAQRMQHYDPLVKGGDHIRGMGECVWATDGMLAFPLMAMRMRLNDYAHFAPWSWLNFWPNFLEGSSNQRHPWKFNDHPDRNDDADGWGSAEVTFVQRALHPYLVLDRGLLEANPAVRGSAAGGRLGWPYRVPRYRAGANVTRAIELFNGGLSGRVLELKWQARWDAPDGPLHREGRSGPMEIAPGFHATCNVQFSLPPDVPRERALYLVLESVRDGKSMCREAHAWFLILPGGAVTAAGSARFLGQDEKTQGDWSGKYGTSGYEIAGAKTELPKDVRVDWSDAATWVWAKRTDETRALTVPSASKDPAAENAGRLAACRYANELDLFVDAPAAGRRLSLYYLDWDRARGQQTFTLWDEEGRVLDRRELGKLPGGCYLTWELRGSVRITIDHQGGPNAVVSGLFLDPVR